MSKAGRKKNRRRASGSRKTRIWSGETTGQERGKMAAGSKPGDMPTQQQGTQR
jgi:hypothetical protein